MKKFFKKVKEFFLNLFKNEVKENEFKRSEKKEVRAFYERLKSKGVNVTIRKEFGTDIDAACGQLRRKFNRCY